MQPESLKNIMRSLFLLSLLTALKLVWRSFVAHIHKPGCVEVLDSKVLNLAFEWGCFHHCSVAGVPMEAAVRIHSLSSFTWFIASLRNITLFKGACWKLIQFRGASGVSLWMHFWTPLAGGYLSLQKSQNSSDNKPYRSNVQPSF